MSPPENGETDHTPKIAPCPRASEEETPAHPRRDGCCSVATKRWVPSPSRRARAASERPRATADSFAVGMGGRERRPRGNNRKIPRNHSGIWARRQRSHPWRGPGPPHVSVAPDLFHPMQTMPMIRSRRFCAATLADASICIPGLGVYFLRLPSCWLGVGRGRDTANRPKWPLEVPVL